MEMILFRYLCLKYRQPKVPHALKGQKLLAQGISLGVGVRFPPPCKGKILTQTTKTNYLFTPLTIWLLISYLLYFKYNYHFSDVLALHGIA